MRWLLLAVLLHCPIMALAAPVSVTSGEHPGFTRLVLDFGVETDWQFGRSSDGYVIRTTGKQRPYDLRGVFRPIGNTRLAAIWADPDSGLLHIGIACACHAIPFQFRPGVIVIDLRDGGPPDGSSFELSLEGGQIGKLTARAPARPKARPAGDRGSYDWLAQTAPPTPPAPAKPIPQKPSLPGMATVKQLNPLRQELIAQLSLGATRGIVDMTPAQHPPNSAIPQDFASAQIAIGGDRGRLASADAPLHGDLNSQGNACIPAERLAISSWATEEPLSEQWASAAADLVGEFDRPDPAALSRMVRFLLHMGFGAEARQALAAFDTELQDSALWTEIGFILDDQVFTANALASQTSCDGPAALWSALAETGPAPQGSNTAAITLAFSELPLHLRRLLGPKLAERFLAADDAKTARAIRDAILRAGDAHADTAVALLESDLMTVEGETQRAQDHLQTVVSTGGTNAVEALAALVELRASQAAAVPKADVATLIAALDETGDPARLRRLVRAVVLGLAASGDPAGAMAMVKDHPELESEVWRLIANLGTDRQVLELAILQEPAKPAATSATAMRLAERLNALGFKKAASVWSEHSGQNDAPEGASPATMLPETTAVADRSAQSALLQARKWSELAKSEPSALQNLAAQVVSAAKNPSADLGQLARMHALVEDSTQTRKLIDTLLDAKPAS